MRVGVTGATGFLGRYVARGLAGEGHALACWRRPTSRVDGLPASIEWVEGGLADEGSMRRLVEGCDAVVHAALDRPGSGFAGAEGDVPAFVDRNVVGTLRLIEAARAAGVGRFVFVSTCAVFDVVLPDRPLDESHPTRMKSHYGAHKAAIEAFVSSYGLGDGYPICALRPCGIYGLADPPADSKWSGLIGAVARGEAVTCESGGKEVHAADVAAAARTLLAADPATIAGQSYNCCDLYVSRFEVAEIARALSGSGSEIRGAATTPRNRIDSSKLRALGARFGGRPRLESTIAEILSAAG